MTEEKIYSLALSAALSAYLIAKDEARAHPDSELLRIYADDAKNDFDAIRELYAKKF